MHIQKSTLTHHHPTRYWCFHHITPGDSTADLFDASVKHLTAILTAEMEAGREPSVLTGDSAVRPSLRLTFAVTFDDGYRSVREHALPVLKALGIKGSVFIPTAYVGLNKHFMSWDDLRVLRDEGWTIGSHTRTHPRMSWRLYNEDFSAYMRRLERECLESREMLARQLRIEADLFAYPFSDAPALAQDVVKRTGYRAAFVVGSPSEWPKSVWTVPRVDGSQSGVSATSDAERATRISVVVPVRDRVDMLEEMLYRLAAQTYPHETFEVIVVDDGSCMALEPALRRGPQHTRLLRCGTPGADFKAGQARTAGAREARFDVLAFLDADVAVGPDYLWALDWVHRRNRRAVVLGYLSGYNLTDLGHIHTVDQFHGVRHIRSLPVIPDRSRERALRGCLDNLGWLESPWTLAYTGNLSLRKELFFEAGAFAQEFTGWGLEDLDLGFRLNRAGVAWVFSRFAVGYHMIDPGEAVSRNPFRAARPARDQFSGYLRNLSIFRERHDSPDVGRFCQSALQDVELLCHGCEYIGINVGAFDSLEDILAEIAQGSKTGSTSAYVKLTPAPGMLDLGVVVREARQSGLLRIVVEVPATTITDPDVAGAILAADIDKVVLAYSAETDAAHEAPLSCAAIAKALDILENTRLELAAIPYTVAGEPGRETGLRAGNESASIPQPQRQQRKVCSQTVYSEGG